MHHILGSTSSISAWSSSQVFHCRTGDHDPDDESVISPGATYWTQCASWVVGLFFCLYFRYQRRRRSNSLFTITDPLSRSLKILPIYIDVFHWYLFSMTFRTALNIYFLITNEKREDYNWFLYFFSAFAYQGCWHSWEWFLAFLLFQRNGGMIAFKRSVFAGVLAGICYTLFNMFSLNYGSIPLLLVYYSLHLLLATIWYCMLSTYSTASKRKGGRFFYLYILGYSIILILGCIFVLNTRIFNRWWGCELINIGYFYNALLEIVMLYIVVRADSKFWRNIATEVTSSSTLNGVRKISLLQNVDDLTNLISLEIPVFDYLKFTDEQYIGHGATSTVFRYKYAGDFIAVKKFFVPTVEFHELSEIVREAFLTRDLHHPNLVDLKGFALVPPDFCIVYEYCSVGSLLKCFDFPSRTRLKLLVDVTSGLKVLHDARIIHRDLKSDNVLVHELSEKKYIAKISDFGMSKHMHTMLASGGSRMIFADIPENLYSTTEVGTVVYSPPEILKHFSWDKFGVNLKVNKTAYDFSVDIYSLAVIFWEVSYGKRAFADETRDIQMLVNDICEGYRPSSVYGLISQQELWGDQFVKLMEQMWQADISSRPSAEFCHTKLKALYDFAEICYSRIGDSDLQTRMKRSASIPYTFKRI